MGRRGHSVSEFVSEMVFERKNRENCQSDSGITRGGRHFHNPPGGRVQRVFASQGRRWRRALRSGGEWRLRDPFFLGRDDLLVRLHSQLQAGQVMAHALPQAISDLGGIGKTQLAGVCLPTSPGLPDHPVSTGRDSRDADDLLQRHRPSAPLGGVTLANSLNAHAYEVRVF